MKRWLSFFIFFLFPGLCFGVQIGPVPAIIRQSDCSTVIATNQLCQDTDDGKVYRGNGSAAVELTALDLSSPGAIGGATPATGAFTTLGASGVATLASGLNQLGPAGGNVPTDMSINGHLIRSNIAGNVVTIQQMQNAGYSTIRYVDDAGIEKGAFGYGNSGSVSYASKIFMETYNATNNAGAWIPFTIQATGVFNNENGTTVRQSFNADGTITINYNDPTGYVPANRIIVNADGVTIGEALALGSGKILNFGGDGTNPFGITTAASTLRIFAGNTVGAAYNIQFGNFNGTTTFNEFMRIMTSGTTAGNVGIGVTVPTAFLHLKAGVGGATVSSAPLKLASGTNLTTPEAGAFEFTTDSLYFTITTGPTRKTIAFLESPSFTTPTLGVATATRIGVGQAADGTNLIASSGFSVDPDGDVVGKSFTSPKVNGVPGGDLLYEATTTETNGVGWKGPASRASDLYLQFSDADPAANQFMLFPAPTTGTSKYVWTTYQAYLGTTLVDFTRASAGLTLAGITLTTPDIGAATGTSLIVTGIVDGLTNITICTDGTESANPAGKMSQVILNKHATPATALAVTLATPVAGMQLIVKNSHGSGGANTGVITLVAGTNIIINNVTDDCAATQNLVSGGAAGDYVAMAGVDSTHYEVVGSKGTWTCTTP